MLKRMSTGSREENYEHVLMCLICRSLFDDGAHQPKFLPCHHTFCKDCLREYVQQIGDDIECPSCRKIATIPAAGVSALQTNFYVKYIQSLVQGSWVPDSATLECQKHPNHKLNYYCKDCCQSVCPECCKTPEEDEHDDESTTEKTQSTCSAHKKVPITTVTEEYHQKLDTSFAQANSMIESKKVELEALLKALSDEKDQALLKIDSTFESHVHTLTRRATLLKNKVIDIFKGHVEKLEWGLDQISWAMTCIVSLKEYHEKDLARGYFKDIDVGIFELNEVFKNINDRVKPIENHIVFDEKHGIEKFRGSAKDLGRVQYSRPNIPRTEPEGGGDPVPEAAANDMVTPTNDESPALLGAVGGHEDSYPSLISALNLNYEEEIPEDVKRKPFPPTHSMSYDSEALRRELNIPSFIEESNPDTNGNNPMPEASIDVALGIKTDSNSNAVTATGAVRPKYLDTKPKKNWKAPKGGPNIARPVKGQRSGNTPPDKCKDPLQVNGEEKKDTAKGLYHRPVDIDLERLKKDKMYHHLVYTSYDEEELLKELQRTKEAASKQN